MRQTDARNFRFRSGSFRASVHVQPFRLKAPHFILNCDESIASRWILDRATQNHLGRE
jgi:hypothetical protein